MSYTHTTDAIWTCDVFDTVGREGRLRTGVIVLTPFARLFCELPPYHPANRRLDDAAEFVRTTYRDEVWYRKPRVFQSPLPELIEKLRAFDLRPGVRTCPVGEPLRVARRDFVERCRLLRRPRYAA